jgi:hypothetical protein
MASCWPANEVTSPLTLTLPKLWMTLRLRCALHIEEAESSTNSPLPHRRWCRAAGLTSPRHHPHVCISKSRPRVRGHHLRRRRARFAASDVRSWPHFLMASVAVSGLRSRSSHYRVQRDIKGIGRGVSPPLSALALRLGGSPRLSVAPIFVPNAFPRSILSRFERGHPFSWFRCWRPQPRELQHAHLRDPSRD